MARSLVEEEPLLHISHDVFSLVRYWQGGIRGLCVCVCACVRVCVCALVNDPLVCFPMQSCSSSVEDPIRCVAPKPLSLCTHVRAVGCRVKWSDGTVLVCDVMRCDAM